MKFFINKIFQFWSKRLFTKNTKMKSNNLLKSVKISYKTNKGLIRPNNEDSLLVISPNGKVDFENKGLLFAVADGMGGHAAGEVASKMACDGLHKYYLMPTQENINQQFVNLFKTINMNILGKSLVGEKLFGMGTTLSSILLHDNQAWIAHVGDSRIYRFRNGSFKQLSIDHTEIQSLLDMGYLSPSEAEKYPARNVLTQAIGVDEKLDVYTNCDAFKPDDLFLLCSDGLYDMVSQDKIFKIISKNALEPEQVSDQLVQAALDGGGKDNISVIVLKI